MMSEQDLADVVQIAVEDLSPGHPVVLENHVVADDDEPALKRQRLEINCQDPSIKSFLYSINQTICLRLDSIEAKLQALEATCKSLEEKLDLVTNKQHSPIQVPMVAGSPLGATQTCNKVRCAVPGRRQNTIVVKVPGQEDSHNEDGESGSEASDSVSNCGQSGSQNIGNNVTLITLNSEEDYPNGTWLGDENNPEMRVRCAIIPSDMLHITTNCRTAEKMALTLLDYLFHREVQAVSNLSGQGKHGKKQLDPLTIYGIRCKCGAPPAPPVPGRRSGSYKVAIRGCSTSRSKCRWSCCGKDTGGAALSDPGLTGPQAALEAGEGHSHSRPLPSADRGLSWASRWHEQGAARLLPFRQGCLFVGRPPRPGPAGLMVLVLMSPQPFGFPPLCTVPHGQISHPCILLVTFQGCRWPTTFAVAPACLSPLGLSTPQSRSASGSDTKQTDSNTRAG
uniref:protein BANP-like isoform X2 n=1 Tax=Halichoerus grypus TaxID=9711 RepID=UPI00165927CB|nr:protein BANP-like isoform X2 [Halichoerus grypus]